MSTPCSIVVCKYSSSIITGTREDTHACTKMCDGSTNRDPGPYDASGCALLYGDASGDRPDCLNRTSPCAGWASEKFEVLVLVSEIKKYERALQRVVVVVLC